MHSDSPECLSRYSKHGEVSSPFRNSSANHKAVGICIFQWECCSFFFTYTVILGIVKVHIIDKIVSFPRQLIKNNTTGDSIQKQENLNRAWNIAIHVYTYTVGVSRQVFGPHGGYLEVQTPAFLGLKSDLTFIFYFIKHLLHTTQWARHWKLFSF